MQECLIRLAVMCMYTPLLHRLGGTLFPIECIRMSVGMLCSSVSADQIYHT